MNVRFSHKRCSLNNINYAFVYSSLAETFPQVFDSKQAGVEFIKHLSNQRCLLNHLSLLQRGRRSSTAPGLLVIVQ